MLTTEQGKSRRFGPATATPVFDAYWAFAAERQSVYFRRLRGHLPPWTADEIIGSFRFTNAYRAADRVSQYLIRHVIYDADRSADDLFFRVMVFKLFNKIETWELLEQGVGEINLRSYRFADYDAVLSEAMDEGTRIYSAAYMMPSANRNFDTDRKHQGHLRLIEKMFADQLPQQISQAASMSDAFDLLLSFPTIGNFLAYQLITDLNYSTLTDFTEGEFVMPGPGALDGISKCFSDFGGLDQAGLIRLVAERQSEEFESRGLVFETLGGRELQLIDCQNLFCEISKYSRVSHPEIPGVSGRTKIKQKFCPVNKELTAWFPPKWQINNSIAAQLEMVGN